MSRRPPYIEESSPLSGQGYETLTAARLRLGLRQKWLQALALRAYREGFEGLLLAAVAGYQNRVYLAQPGVWDRLLAEHRQRVQKEARARVAVRKPVEVAWDARDLPSGEMLTAAAAQPRPVVWRRREVEGARTRHKCARCGGNVLWWEDEYGGRGWKCVLCARSARVGEAG